MGYAALTDLTVCQLTRLNVKLYVWGTIEPGGMEGAIRIISINADDNGDSYFGDHEAGDPRSSDGRIPVDYWQLWQTLPGHFADFKPVEKPQFLAIMAGKLEITVSTGETRYFSRGDTFLIQDIRGKGHAIRTVGAEPCAAMLITLKRPVTSLRRAQ
jgi:hypothetical protein